MNIMAVTVNCDSLVHIKFVPNCHLTEEVEVLAISNLRIVVILVGEERERERGGGGEGGGGREGERKKKNERGIALFPGSTIFGRWSLGTRLYNLTTSHLQ